VGRRGPVQAACNAKELRELLGIKGLTVKVHDSDLTTSPADLPLWNFSGRDEGKPEK